MCGIAGVLIFNEEDVNENYLRKFTLSLNHRGPDSNNLYIDNDKKLGLGHTRASIFDLSNDGIQPMSYYDKRYWITFNGIIYNFIEIKNELKSLGYKFKNNTDTEVILASYLEWGDDCQFKFNGDWAFAIWDVLKKNLFLSVDRFGSKPLYYINHKNYFIFASELKAFMRLPKDKVPNFDYGHFLWLGKSQGCINTFLNNVFLLPGGNQININQNKKFEFKKWWRTIEHLVDVPERYEDQVSQFESLFYNACKIRLRSDVPIAAGLSGGIDSSSIVNLVEKIKKDSPNINNFTKDPLKTFFCEFKNNDRESEKKFAIEAIINKNISPNYLQIDPKKITLEEIHKAQFYPENIDTDTVQLSLLYKKMKEVGFSQSIDGVGGDELLGGYWEDPIHAMKDVCWPWQKKKRFLDLAMIKKNINNEKKFTSKYIIILRNLLGEVPYRYIVSSLNHRSMRMLFYKNRYDLINKSKLTFPEKDNISSLDNFNSYTYKAFHYLSPVSHGIKWDKIAMSHGIGSRAPFLDNELVRFIFSIKSEAKIGNGFTKRILRDSMKNIVSKNILKRQDKKGFTSPKDWYEKNMYNYINDNLNSSEFLNSNIFNAKRIKKDYESKKYLFRDNGSKRLLRYIYINQLIKSFKNFSNNYV
jgi:asparagine synthase (glutamine-hydrolysing)